MNRKQANLGEKNKARKSINAKMKNKKKPAESASIVETSCNDRKCPFHGSLSVRGRRFRGVVTRVYSKTASLEFERVVYYPKYERYSKAKTKLHAHVPDCIAATVKSGKLVTIGECRPLSKTVHHVILQVEK